MFYKTIYRKYFSFFFLILYFIFLQNKNYPQDSSSVKKSLDEILISDILISIDNTGSYFTQPLRFDSQDWLVAAGLTDTTLLMITADQSITNKVGRTSTRYFNDTFWDVITEYGSIE